MLVLIAFIGLIICFGVATVAWDHSNNRLVNNKSPKESIE